MFASLEPAPDDEYHLSLSSSAFTLPSLPVGPHQDRHFPGRERSMDRLKSLQRPNDLSPASVATTLPSQFPRPITPPASSPSPVQWPSQPPTPKDEWRTAPYPETSWPTRLNPDNDPDYITWLGDPFAFANFTRGPYKRRASSVTPTELASNAQFFLKEGEVVDDDVDYEKRWYEQWGSDDEENPRFSLREWWELECSREERRLRAEAGEEKGWNDGWGTGNGWGDDSWGEESATPSVDDETTPALTSLIEDDAFTKQEILSSGDEQAEEKISSQDQVLRIRDLDTGLEYDLPQSTQETENRGRDFDGELLYLTTRFDNGIDELNAFVERGIDALTNSISHLNEIFKEQDRLIESIDRMLDGGLGG